MKRTMMPIPTFKVWDTQERKWVHGFIITQDGLLCRPEHLPGGDISVKYWSGRYIACVFINRKDKDGTEVCCGDIIEKHGARYLVRYFDDSGCFGGERLDKPGFFYWLVGITLSHVIGNRFENPELLPEKESN